MTEKQIDKVEWRGVLTINFAPEFGSSLDELEDEYDELITNFDNQKSSFHEIVPEQAATKEISSFLTVRPPSPTPSNSSRCSNKKSVGIRKIISHAGIQIRRRFSNRDSLRRKASLLKKKKNDSDAKCSSTLETRSLNNELGSLRS